MKNLLAMIFAVAVIASVPAVFADTDVKILNGTSDKSCRTDQGCFSPFDIEIDVGETVTWTNEDIVPHKIATWDGPGQIGQTFQSPVLNTGDIFSYTFAKSGTFWYYSPDYEWAEGRVIVRGDSQGSESDRTERESDLATENQRLRQEISSLRNQVNQLEQRIQDLQSIIMEQLKVIVDTLKTIKGN